MRGLIGQKVGMTRVFNSSGDVVPVTVLNVGPCVVTQVKTLNTCLLYTSPSPRD